MPQLQTTAPPRYIALLQRVEYLRNSVVLASGICLRGDTSQGIQFFVVVILRLGISLQQRLTFTYQMLAAAPLRPAQ